MPQVTIDQRSAEKLEKEGWLKVQYNCAYWLQPPGIKPHSKFEHIFNPKMKQVDPNQPAKKADLIRVLLKEGKTRKEAIKEMLKRFPKGSKAGITSQVYMAAKTL